MVPGAQDWRDGRRGLEHLRREAAGAGVQLLDQTPQTGSPGSQQVIDRCVDTLADDLVALADAIGALASRYVR